MKYVILIGDGMGDLPLAELDGKTPMEAARTPAMDRVSGAGELLRVRTVPEGYPPGSDVANLSLLGYRPETYYTGRAPLEAASMGVALADDELAVRCNLVTTRQEANGALTMVDYSAGHISTGEARELITMLQAELGSGQLRFYPGVSYRHLLVHRGALAGLATVPPHDHTGRDVSSYWQAYRKFPHLRELLEKAGPLLAAHPVNTARQARGANPANNIWLWGEGKAPAMETLAQRFGVTGGLISAVDLLKGLGVYGGLEIVNVPGATGYLDTNYEGKAQAALDILRHHGFVFVHVEAPDEAGHQGLIKEKIQAIEDFDQRIVLPILAGLEKAGTHFRLAIGMDHYTPIAKRTHIDRPVPMAIYDSRRPQGCGLAFNEQNAEQSPLLDNGQLFMERLLERQGK